MPNGRVRVLLSSCKARERRELLVEGKGTVVVLKLKLLFCLFHVWAPNTPDPSDPVQ